MTKLARIAAAALAVAPAIGLAATTTWDIDPAHSNASFTAKHLVISNVRGELGKVAGTVVMDDSDLARSRVEATIDVTALNTRQPQRDAHLKSPDFFDAAKYPNITFKSTKVEKDGEGKLKVTGDLTIKGTTKPAVLEVEGPTPAIKGMQGETRRAVQATTRINRKEFGLNWNKMVEAGPVVGDTIRVEISAEMIKQGQEPKAAAATKAEAKK